MAVMGRKKQMVRTIILNRRSKEKKSIKEERSIEEVSVLLDQYLEFYNAYENINRLYGDNWESIVH